jgi:hypothetical protein
MADQNSNNDTYRADVIDVGNGWPDVGAYLERDGALYRVVKPGSRIDTTRRGNTCRGYVLAPAEWDELFDDEDPHTSIVMLWGAGR